MTEIVTTDRVRFANGIGDVLVGDLYRPHRVDASDLPALVVTGSWMTVKEQMAGLYARRLAEQGFISLAFDFTGFGQSAGGPRDVENPLRKKADIHAAVDYLETVHGADSQRLGALAICASSGYTCANAAVDARIRSVGLVAPWLHNAELVKPYYGGSDGIADRIKAGGAARRRYELDGTVEYIPAVSERNPLAAMFGPYDYYLDPSRGAIPEWGERFATMAWEDWLTYDPLAFARDISQPVRIVHSRDGAVPADAEAFAEQLAGRAELIWTEGSAAPLETPDRVKRLDLQRQRAPERPAERRARQQRRARNAGSISPTAARTRSSRSRTPSRPLTVRSMPHPPPGQAQEAAGLRVDARPDRPRARRAPRPRVPRAQRCR